MVFANENGESSLVSTLPFPFPFVLEEGFFAPYLGKKGDKVVFSSPAAKAIFGFSLSAS